MTPQQIIRTLLLSKTEWQWQVLTEPGPSAVRLVAGQKYASATYDPHTCTLYLSLADLVLLQQKLVEVVALAEVERKGTSDLLPPRPDRGRFQTTSRQGIPRR